MTEEGQQHGELRSRRAAEFSPRESAAGLRSLATAGAGSIDPGLAVEVGGFVGTNPAADSTGLGPSASQILRTRHLHPAAFSVPHVPAALSIDPKGPTITR